MAYTVVKDTWIEKGLWHRKWGVLPGMSWKHELPFEQYLRDEMGDDSAGDDSTDDAADHMPHEASPIWSIFPALAPHQPSAVCAPNLPDNLQQPSDEGAGNAVQLLAGHFGGLFPADSDPRLDAPGVSSQVVP